MHDVCIKYNLLNYRQLLSVRSYEGELMSPQPDQEGNKLQRPNSGFIQHTPNETEYTS